MQTWDHNQVGTLLQALADQESNSNRHHDRDDGFDVNAELELVADIDGESDLSGWLWESAPDSEEKSRIDKVYSYLREREARKWVWRDGNVYRRDAHA